jgi:hypothetical protein
MKGANEVRDNRIGLVFLTPSQAFSWGDDGHKAIALIAHSNA